MTASSPRDRPPKVSVVIPNYNGAALLEKCLKGLAQQVYRDFEVILVDNGSSDNSIDLARKACPNLTLIELDRNLGFAAAVNKGIKSARGSLVALLNNDALPRTVWLRALVRTMDEHPPEMGAVASKMLLEDDPLRIDDAGDRLSWTGSAEKVGHRQPSSRFTERREVFSACAGATLYRKAFLEEVGYFDEKFFAYLEDIDLGLRGRLCGYRYLFEPTAEVLHKGHGTRIPKSDYVRLMTRNRLMLFFKNMPGKLLVKHLSRQLYGQLYFLIAYRKPWDSLMGYVTFIQLLPHVVRERRRISRQRVLPNETLDQLLSTEMNEPTLRQLFRRRLKRTRS
jgi:GT2 family glycosyltransferase